MQWARSDGSLRRAVAAAVLSCIAWGGPAGGAFAQNLEPGISARFVPIAQVRSTAPSATTSAANVVNMTRHPALPGTLAGSAYNSWLTVTDSRGPVSLVNISRYTAGVTNAYRTVVDLRTATQGLDVGNLSSGNSELGVRWFEYHPDFAVAGSKGYAKAYTMSCHTTSTRTLPGAVALDHAAPPGAPTRCDNVLTEWSINPSTMTASTPRQVMRWPQIYANHGTDALVFDPATKLLYIAVGDGGSQGDPFDVSQNKNYLYGKLLRIDPTRPGTTLPAGMARAAEGTYSYPLTNPYTGAGDSGRNAIYAIGFRHPETMIRDNSDLFVFDIGGADFEEINVVKVTSDRGRNFGWDKVEGRVPVNTATVPPVAGYAHVDGNRAIVGGAAPEAGPYAGQVVVGDIVSGNLYYASRSALKAARSWGTPMVPLRRFVLHDAAGNPRTLMAAYGRNGRVDLRLAEIGSRRVLGVSKQRGIVFELLPL
jgi:hypothetical protein